jgi:hypothetical protein
VEIDAGSLIAETIQWIVMNAAIPHKFGKAGVWISGEIGDLSSALLV